MAFTLSFARHQAKELLPPECSASQLDCEGIADMAVLVLRWGAKRIGNDDAREWYRGVIRNLVRKEIQSEWRYLTGTALPEDLREETASLPDDGTSSDDVELTDVTVHENARLLEAIKALPPSLRPTATLMFIEHRTRAEVCAILGINRVSLQKRILRMRPHLRPRLVGSVGEVQRKVSTPKPFEILLPMPKPPSWEEKAEQLGLSARERQTIAQFLAEIEPPRDTAPTSSRERTRSRRA